jgi:hypothetical protein
MLSVLLNIRDTYFYSILTKGTPHAIVYISTFVFCNILSCFFLSFHKQTVDSDRNLMFFCKLWKNLLHVFSL